jgi:transposase
MQSKEKNERHASRTRFIMALIEGRAQLEPVTQARVPLKRAMTYRLLRAVRLRGEGALEDGRHGHPIKLRGATRQFLEEYCREAPHTPSCIVQTLLQERFGASVSISQINRVRRQLGVSNHPKKQKKPRTVNKP